jgi:hypothetical protein
MGGKPRVRPTEPEPHPWDCAAPPAEMFEAARRAFKNMVIYGQPEKPKHGCIAGCCCDD